MRSMTPTIIVICLALVTLTALAAFAQQEFPEFWEFRYTSGLPGGGWGVTPDGVPGFEGAMQLNVPVAYTPHRGAVIGYSSASFDSSIRIESEGPDSNGTGYIGFGMGKSGRGLFLCEMPTSNRWEPSQNAQQQVIPAGSRRPAVAVGLQDIFGNREEVRGRPHTSETPYVVATQQVGQEEHPVYLTLGYGGGRFNDSFFGGVSWRALDKLTVIAEHDGFNANAALAVDLSDWVAEDTILFAGMVDMDRAVIGVSYVYSDLAL